MADTSSAGRAGGQPTRPRFLIHRIRASAQVLVGSLPQFRGLRPGLPASPPSPTRRRRTVPSSVLVEVESHNWSDIVIYLDRGNLSERLGTVGTLHTVIFTFPYLRARHHRQLPPASSIPSAICAASSELINIQPGQSLKWTIENDIERSFLSAY